MTVIHTIELRAALTRLPFTLAVGVATAFLVAPNAVAQAGSRDRSANAAAGRLPMDSAITTGTLSNGLHYYIQSNAVPAHRAELRLVVDAGSVLEDSTQRGLAHFVEHMAFNGTTHFRKLDIVRYLEAMGMQFGADLNAATSADETIYRFTIPTDRADAVLTGIRILADWAHGITFDSAAVEAERGIILGEWRSRTDGGVATPINDRNLADLLRGSRYTERTPIGLPRIIESAPRSEIARFYHDWYRPDRMAVVVVGDVKVKVVEALIQRELGAIPAVQGGRARPSLEVPVHTTPVYSVMTNPDVAEDMVFVAYRLPPHGHGTATSFRQDLIQQAIQHLMSERLRDLDRGTIGIEEPVRDVREFALRAPVRGGETGAALATMLGVVQQVVQHGFTPTELGRARAGLLSQYQSSYARRMSIPSSVYADALAADFLGGGSAPGVGKLLELARGDLADSSATAIKLDELNAAARAGFGQPGRVVLVAVSPASPSATTEQDVARLADSVTRTTTPKYEEAQLQMMPLVPTPPTPGRVDSSRTLAEIGAQEWVLSNGAHVVLKSTHFNSDQILFQASAPGGTSVAADSDYIEAQLATWALSTSGLGAFTRPLLEKRLRGTTTSLDFNAYIGELSQGMRATTAPRDLETMFQLMYLTFTAHRVDTAAIAIWRGKAREQLATPEAIFNQSLRSLVTRNAPRARPIMPAMVDSLDAARTLAFYRERFADASAFTFYIVGAFDPDSIKPLVERYIGGLPTTHANRKWSDTGVRLATEGAIDFNGGSVGKTTTELIFRGEMSFSVESNMLLTTLAEIAQRRLLDRLRTKLHATYAVQVSHSAERWPYEHFELTVAFDAAPEQADSLAKAALAVLDTLRASGPTSQEVADVKALEQRRIQLGLQDNGYWIQTLSQDRWNGWDDGTGLTNIDQLLDALTPERMKSAAKRFLDTGHILRIALRPHKETS